jgi:hypothetical protein
MRKYFPFILCSVAALSYSQLGAAADADPGEKPADASRNATAGATSSSDTTRDARAGEYRNKDDKRAGKQEGDASWGSSSSKTNKGKSMEKDDSTSAAPGSSATPGSTPKGTGY